MGEWLRARRAYADLLGAADPVADLMVAGAVDLRPGGPIATGPLRVVTSGPDDLVELVRAVESVTGPGTWPRPGIPLGWRVAETHRARVALGRPTPALALVAAMEGLITDRTGAWRTWRTTLETVAAAVAPIGSLTVDARVLDRV